MTEHKEMLGTQADATIFRKLRELSYRSSYSHRGRYYTLDEVADYDEWGLWLYRSVWFSRRGSLMATAEALVECPICLEPENLHTEMVQCETGGHSFCRVCVRQHAETQVGEGASNCLILVEKCHFSVNVRKFGMDF